MDTLQLYATVAAVIAGNILSGMLLYFLFYVGRLEKLGLPARKAPLRVFAVGMVPLVVLVAGLYLAR